MPTFWKGCNLIQFAAFKNHIGLYSGPEAAMLAPTAVNQQKFRFELDGEKVSAVSTGGFYSKIDLGIVKYHFEAASGHKVN